MITSEITSSHDLGKGWWINFIKDSVGVESATVRNTEKGQRIDLPANSLKTLREILVDTVEK